MSIGSSNLKVNGDRLWKSLDDMAMIGPGVRGGNNRQALTDADRDGRNLFARWANEAGCTLKVDTMGNMFARRAGTDESLPPVVVGSHLDTQPTGGRYDGVLGVLAGLELVRTLNDLNIRTRHPIEVVNWTNEEGTRFTPAMLCSGVFAGVYTRVFADTLKDADGKTFGEELARIGFLGSEPCAPRPLKAYLELHIEQGPALYTEGIEIGVVTHNRGMRWFDVTLTGVESHAGTTPMDRRKDALFGAAEIVQAVERIALSRHPRAVGTVGSLNVFPGSRNVIPGRVSFTVDLRHSDDAQITLMCGEMRQAVADASSRRGLEATIEEVFYFAPVTHDATCVAAVRKAAGRLGLSHRDIESGAGHDACYVARIAPTAMIFCPCVDGISHNESESIRPRWAAAGADVLLHSVLDIAEMVD